MQGCSRKANVKGDCLERRLGQFADLSVGLCKKERGGGVFQGGDTPMHTMFNIYVYFLSIFFLFLINKDMFLSFSFLLSDEI